MIVYRAINILNGETYIGCTKKTLNERINQHYKYGFKFYNALKKYGKDNFIWDIIYKCDNYDELLRAEKFYIKFFNTKEPNGYNLTEGGYGSEGHIVSKETKEKLRKINLGKKQSEETIKKKNDILRGQKRTEDVKKKISESKKGKIVLEETRKKISNKLKGQKSSLETKQKMSESKSGEKNPFFGKKHSQETIDKISNKLKNHIPWNKGIKMKDPRKRGKK